LLPVHRLRSFHSGSRATWTIVNLDNLINPVACQPI
jgi:hypothetical protein